MKKLSIALLVATLCMVAPAIAFDWEALPADTQVIVYTNPTLGAYFDVAIGEDAYPAWCAEVNAKAITHLYDADLTTTIGAGEKWNKINWVLNHKGNANPMDVQLAIWKIQGQDMGWYDLSYCFSRDAKRLVKNADPEFIPTYGEIGAVLVVPKNNYRGQDVIIEVEMPCLPEPEPTPTPTPTPTPVPEFPTIMIPVFLVGSLLIVGSVLKKE